MSWRIFLILTSMSMLYIEAQASPDACTLLTRDLITQFSPNTNKQSLELVLSVPPPYVSGVEWVGL